MKSRNILALLIALSLITLAGCGGGGGSGGGGGGSGSGGGGGGGTSAGAFTVDKTSIAFIGRQNRPPPASQTIAVTLTGTNIATVGAAYRAGQQPSWLDVSITGSGTTFTVHLSINTTALPVGPLSATLLLGTADASNNILQNREIAVSYDMRTAVSAFTPSTGASFVFGDSRSSDAFNVSVTASNTSWTMTSNVAWLAPPAGTQSGSQTVAVAANVSSLDPGTYTGTLTITNAADATDVATITVLVTMDSPTLTVTPANIVLGGTDGLGGASQPLSLTLNTSTSAYPWSVALSDTSARGWLSATATSGSVASAVSAITLNADISRVPPGSYAETADFSVIVKGRTFHKSVPVTLNFESHRLFVAPNGVAFSSFPGRSVLTRTLPVRSSRGKTGIAWTATSDSAWLSVTPNGVTGDSIVLTANPSAAGVLTDAYNIALVTLASTDPAIQGTETLRVGLWRGSADPQNVSTDVAPGVAIAVNPVEPLVYVAADPDLDTKSKSVAVYNLYTGQPAPVQKFANIGTNLRALAVSTDGRRLYVVDEPSRDVIGLDARTGTEVSRYHTNPLLGFFADPIDGMLAIRPNARSILLSPYGEVYDVESGNLMQQNFVSSVTNPGGFGGLIRHTTVDARHVYGMQPNTSSSEIIHSTLLYSALGGGSLTLDTVGRANPALGLGSSDLSICNATSRVYATTSIGDKVQVFDLDSTQQVDQFDVGGGIPFACDRAGRLYAGISNNTGPDLLIYSTSLTVIGTLRTGPTGISRVERSQRLSGDETRIVTRYYDIPGKLTLYSLP